MKIREHFNCSVDDFVSFIKDGWRVFEVKPTLDKENGNEELYSVYMIQDMFEGKLSLDEGKDRVILHVPKRWLSGDLKTIMNAIYG